MKTNEMATESLTQAQIRPTEAQNQIIIAKDLQYISNKEFEELFNKSIIVSKLVNGLIKSASNHPHNT